MDPQTQERMKREAALEQEYQGMRQQCKQLTYKINEIKMDADEHDLVIKALEPLDPTRKCFRMVDAIVVERNVANVLPAVRKNLDQVIRRLPLTPALGPIPLYSLAPLKTASPLRIHTKCGDHAPT